MREKCVEKHVYKGWTIKRNNLGLWEAEHCRAKGYYVNFSQAPKTISLEEIKTTLDTPTLRREQTRKCIERLLALEAIIHEHTPDVKRGEKFANMRHVPFSEKMAIGIALAEIKDSKLYRVGGHEEEHLRMDALEAETEKKVKAEFDAMSPEDRATTFSQLTPDKLEVLDLCFGVRP